MIWLLIPLAGLWLIIFLHAVWRQIQWDTEREETRFKV